MQLIQGLGKMPGININYLIQMLAREFDYLDIKQMFPQSQQTANSPMSMQQFNKQEATAGESQIPNKQIAAGASALPEGGDNAYL